MEEKELFYSKEIMGDLKNIYNKLKKDNDKIDSLNQNIDNEIQDILHYIELKSFNVPEGYFAIKDLKRLLIARRRNVNSKKEIKEILDFFNGKTNIVTLDRVVSDIRYINESATVKIVKKLKTIDKKDCLTSYESLLSGDKNSESFAILLSEMIKKYEEQRDSLKVAMSSVEKNMNLLLSKIEFSNFALIEGYEYAKMLKLLRIERRNIKDEFDRFKYLDAILLNNNKIKPSIEKVEKQEELKQKRVYTPRVLKSYGVMTS